MDGFSGVVRELIQVLSIIAAIVIYGFIWKLVATCIMDSVCCNEDYSHPILVKIKHFFCGLWIVIHILGIIGVIIWAWNPALLAKIFTKGGN